MVGLLPTRLVQTLKLPFGVEMGIIRTPPVNTSLRPALLNQAAGGAGLAALQTFINTAMAKANNDFMQSSWGDFSR